MSNTNFNKASKTKNDEFYTRITDIEKELKHYKEHFKGKTVFCNCNDGIDSQFWLYFRVSFDSLGLKRLISTSYNQEKAYKRETLDGKTITETLLQGNGDFRSPETIEILKESNIVVTNPPFSIFREYSTQLIEHDKKFLIIGNMNAITYKEVFKLIKENTIWLGCSNPKGFVQPDGSVKVFGNIAWFTNLHHEKRNDFLPLYKKYIPEKYPKYDNYNAIEVSKTKEIPEDYEGVMGVPISFLDKYNPEQFEILGIDRPLVEEHTGKVSRFFLNGKEVYARIVIKNRNPQREIL